MGTVTAILASILGVYLCFRPGIYGTKWHLLLVGALTVNALWAFIHLIRTVS